MQLFMIGDSLAQGFMSGAAAQSDLCFSTHVAGQLGIADYRFPHWPHGGLPIKYGGAPLSSAVQSSPKRAKQ